MKIQFFHRHQRFSKLPCNAIQRTQIQNYLKCYLPCNNDGSDRSAETQYTTVETDAKDAQNSPVICPLVFLWSIDDSIYFVHCIAQNNNLRVRGFQTITMVPFIMPPKVRPWWMSIRVNAIDPTMLSTLFSPTMTFSMYLDNLRNDCIEIRYLIVLTLYVNTHWMDLHEEKRWYPQLTVDVLKQRRNILGSMRMGTKEPQNSLSTDVKGLNP